MGALVGSLVSPATVAYTVVPLVALLVAAVLSAHSIRRHGHAAHVLLVSIVVLMALHQVGELFGYVHTPGESLLHVGELFETAVNLLTALAVSYVNRVEHLQTHLTQNLAALSRFLRHDLRNDLTVVLGHLAIVDDRALDQRSATSLMAADDVLRRFAAKADRARDLETFIQRLPVDRDVVRLDAVLAETVATARARYDGAIVQTTGPDAVEVLAGDLLGDVVTVLLENAVEHNDGPAPAVEVCVEETARTVTVAVHDSGPGIPDAQKALFVDSDERDDHAHAEGLGLFFVRVVVEEWRGSLSFRDHPAGSTVAITLPKPTLEQRAIEAIPMT